MQITAAVLRDRSGRYELEDVTLADPGPGHILVRIVGAGHCHTDLLARAEHSTSPLPLVVGHEGSGVVEAVAANTEGIAVGDHVVLSYDSCRRCANCLAGHPAYCLSFVRRNFGLTQQTGDLTGRVVVGPAAATPRGRPPRKSAASNRC
jgi:aryl-alcohol dehydrogenase